VHAAAPPVAILCVTSGTVRVAERDRPARQAGRWEWLGTGARFDVAADGGAVLAFADGRRQQLAPGTRARLTQHGAVASRGAVRDLPPLPALADVLALADSGRPGTRAGAVRVRGPRVTGLSPGAGAATLAGATVLRFDAVAGAPRYRVDVLDAAGRSVYGRDIESPALEVPPDVLRPGSRYTWKVRTLDRPGPAAEAREWFYTLAAAAAAARERLQKEAAAGPAAATLLAAVDQRLRLVTTAAGER